MLDDAELRAIDTWRFKERMPSRAAAIRELIRRGISTTDDPENLAAIGAGNEASRSSDFGVIDVGHVNDRHRGEPERSD